MRANYRKYCALVAQGLGVALIHPYTAAVVQRYGLTSRPIQGKHRLSLVAATAPQQQHSLLALKLVELLQQQFS